METFKNQAISFDFCLFNTNAVLVNDAIIERFPGVDNSDIEENHKLKVKE